MAKGVLEAAATSWLRGVCPRTGLASSCPSPPSSLSCVYGGPRQWKCKGAQGAASPQTTQGLWEDQLPGGSPRGGAVMTAQWVSFEQRSKRKNI